MSYFHHIGLKNFRLFDQRTTFKLAPITLITGINNSGKSSLIKSLQLFKGSAQETKGITKLSFGQGRHNLGHFGNCINKKSEEKEMTFEFDFELPHIKDNGYLSLTYVPSSKASEQGTLVTYRIYIESGETLLEGKFEENEEGRNNHYINFEKLFELFSKIFDQTYKDHTIELSKELREPHSDFSLVHGMGEANLNLKYRKIFELFKMKYIRDFIFEGNSLHFEAEAFDGEKFFVKDLDIVDIEIKEQIKDTIAKYFVEGVSAEFTEGESKNVLSTIDWGTAYWRSKIERAYPKINENGWAAVAEYILSVYIPYLNKSLADFHGRFDSIHSLSSLRANTSRLYSNTSDIVDINGLILEFSQLDLVEGDEIINFIQNQLRLFEIGDEIEITRHQGVASEISIIKNGEKTLLADLGYGYSQFLPLIIKVALIAYNKRYFFEGGTSDFSYPPSILLLEEPESNLHPSYQSKLADFIVAATVEFNIQFLVETHSEYMIRNFQYLTATKKLASEDVKIYYFHQPDSPEFEESPYREIEILTDGRLSKEFGKGFFDETPRLLSNLFNSSFN